MRRLDKSCLDTMQSPIRHLMAEHLGNSLFAIAPERRAEFNTALDNFDLIYLNQRQWEFCADPAGKPPTVWVSRGAVELIWCASLAHFLFYTRMIQGKRFDVPSEVDPNSDPATSDALRLLRWAILCQLNGEAGDDWPTGLPSPMQNPSKESDENVADELCLVT